LKDDGMNRTKKIQNDGGPWRCRNRRREWQL